MDLNKKYLDKHRKSNGIINWKEITKELIMTINGSKLLPLETYKELARQIKTMRDILRKVICQSPKSHYQHYRIPEKHLEKFRDTLDNCLLRDYWDKNINRKEINLGELQNIFYGEYDEQKEKPTELKVLNIIPPLQDITILKKDKATTLKTPYTPEQAKRFRDSKC